MLKLILVRHGETEWNAERRYQGHADVPLSVLGRQQAELVSKRLVNEEIDAIYASDLQRAWQTALTIAKRKSLVVNSEARLREMSFGVLEGLTWDEAEAKYPEMLKAWLTDYNRPPEGGEGLDVFSERILTCRDDFLRKHDGERILLVAHGGSLSELVRLSLDVPSAKRWAFRIDNASFSELWLGDDGYPILKSLNGVGHLK